MLKCVLTLSVFDNFRIVRFEDGNAGVGSSKIDSNDAAIKTKLGQIMKEKRVSDSAEKKNVSAVQSE